MAKSMWVGVSGRRSPRRARSDRAWRDYFPPATPSDISRARADDLSIVSAEPRWRRRRARLDWALRSCRKRTSWHAWCVVEANHGPAVRLQLLVDLRAAAPSRGLRSPRTPAKRQGALHPRGKPPQRPGIGTTIVDDLHAWLAAHGAPQLLIRRGVAAGDDEQLPWYRSLLRRHHRFQSGHSWRRGHSRRRGGGRRRHRAGALHGAAESRLGLPGYCRDDRWPISSSRDVAHVRDHLGASLVATTDGIEPMVRPLDEDRRAVPSYGCAVTV